MAIDPQAPIVQARLRHLTREDLDRRIGLVAEEVTAEAFVGSPFATSDEESLRPRWIRPADLVRRMQPYIVYN